MTSNPGGEDMPGDYSPDGKRFVFARSDQNGGPVGLYVVRTNGSRLRPITPSGTIVQRSAGSWSPQGNAIVFARRVRADIATRCGSFSPTERAAHSAPSATWLRRTNL